MAYIYALCDPITKVVRYVGKADKPSMRAKNHRNEVGNTRKCRWIAGLQRRGLTPELLILEELAAGTNWQERERFWIGYYLGIGADLTNHTAGGEGLNGASPETREKLRQIRLDEWNNPERRAQLQAILQSPERRSRISASLKGKPHRSEHVAKLPQNRPGWHQTQTTKQKISDAMLGNQHLKGHYPSGETRRKIADSLRGNTHTLGRVMPEAEKLQRSLSLRGRGKGEDHKAKIRNGQIEAWKRRKEERG